VEHLPDVILRIPNVSLSAAKNLTNPNVVTFW